jgi:nucleoside-diphosphate-sugar epimerase
VSAPAAGGDTALVTGVSALVSGATGFLGSRLALALARRGCCVHALRHHRPDDGTLAAAGVKTVEGDLLDRASLVRAAAGCRIVFHTAGKVTDWGPRREFFAMNETGTANVIAACREAGVSRLVHMSSLTVLGFPRTGETVTEETPYAGAAPDPYSQSKIAGERLVRAAHEPGRFETVVVRSGVIWGPGDITILPRLAALLGRGVMPYIDGGRNHVALSHVDNLAGGMLLAADARAAAGQVYHMTDGEDLTAREVIDEIAAALGVPPPRLSLPFGAVLAAAWLAEALARLARRTKPPRVTRFGVRLVASDCRYDIGKARRELGYRPGITMREGVRALGLGCFEGDRGA